MSEPATVITLQNGEEIRFLLEDAGDTRGGGFLIRVFSNREPVVILPRSNNSFDITTPKNLAAQKVEIEAAK